MSELGILFEDKGSSSTGEKQHIISSSNSSIEA